MADKTIKDIETSIVQIGGSLYALVPAWAMKAQNCPLNPKDIVRLTLTKIDS